MSDTRPIVSAPEKGIFEEYWKTANTLPEGFEEGETTTETPIEE